MAHAKAVNRKKNTDDFPDSPHHTPIGGDRRRDNDDYEDTPALLPKKKKKIRPPTSLNTSVINDDNAEESGSSGSAAQEVEIVFKLHPDMLADIEQKEVVDAMKDNVTRYIKTTSRALVEHLCKYLAMRIALDLANKKPSDSTASASTSASSGNSSVKDLTIYIASVPGQMTPLTTSLALTQVNEKYWKVNKPMEMFYSFNRV
jgi:E3 ubiquitin-protein ligase RNF1/2